MTLSDYLQDTTQTAFAEMLGVTQGLVHQWLNGDTKITAERAREIEIKTGGKVTRMELRPDLFGPIELPQASRSRAARRA